MWLISQYFGGPFSFFGIFGLGVKFLEGFRQDCVTLSGRTPPFSLAPAQPAGARYTTTGWRATLRNWVVPFALPMAMRKARASPLKEGEGAKHIAGEVFWREPSFYGVGERQKQPGKQRVTTAELMLTH